MIKILNLFQVETEYFSKEKQTTISKIWPRLSALILSLKEIESENHIFQEMKALMIEDLEFRCKNIFTDEIIIISTILDPVFKSLMVFDVSEINELKTPCSENEKKLYAKELKRIQEEKKKLYQIVIHHFTITNTNERAIIKERKSPQKLLKFMNFKPKGQEKTFEEIQEIRNIQVQMRLFLEEDIEINPEEDSNPIQYWFLNKHRYPLLSQVAFKYLSIPSGSVGVERRFSTNKFLIFSKYPRVS